MGEKRIYECPKCGKKILFKAPEKPAVYRLTCPNCKDKVIFKVEQK